MTDFLILIPSYKRAKKQYTLEFLSPVYPKDKIIISTQSIEDYNQYQKHSDKATIIYKRGDNVATNRNTLLEFAQDNGIKRALMLDDDIYGILLKKSNGERERIKDPARVKSIFDGLFKVSEKYDATLWGGYPLDHTLMLNNKITESILVGQIMGINDTSIRFNEFFALKEDYEICCRLITSRKRVIRYNFISTLHRANNAEGGCNEFRNKNYKIYTDVLLGAYPNLLKRVKETEIKFTRL